MIDKYLYENDLLKCTLSAIDGVSIARGDEDYAKRVMDMPMSYDLFCTLSECAQTIGVTKNFKEVIDYFKVPANETPAGFRLGFELKASGLLLVDLVRDISYDKNCEKRPTQLLFSADSANPYEVVSIKNLIANLTCNPAIIYNMFINNPKANVGNKFKTRDEVMAELARILGPGIDISVELNDPFSTPESQLLEEAARFREILGKWRTVIKIPHTGPVNSGNVNELLTGDKMFKTRYNAGSAESNFRGHNLALLMKENGYKVNFTLMFDQYQTSMALQARPYFINSFVMFRQTQTQRIKGLLGAYEVSGDDAFLEELRNYMVQNDYLASGELALDLHTVKSRAEYLSDYRGFEACGYDGFEGLDGVKHNLRVMRTCNMEDSRLIICNIQGEEIYPFLDTTLFNGEFDDVMDKIVITSPPAHLAQFTSSPLVVQFHRRFMNAAAGQK
ncbi:MAG: transaldolase family protein [Eubacteriales bacterium]